MKNIYISGCIVLVLVGLGFFMNLIGKYQALDSDGVPFKFKECETTKQCAFTHAKCSCSCGAAINKVFADKFNQERENYCSNYDGPICDMTCPQTELICVQGLCQNVE